MNKEHTSFLTKIVSTTRRNRGLSTKAVAGFVVLSQTLVKPKKDCKTERRSTPKLSLITQVGHASAVADHSTSTGHGKIKWDHLEILASGQCDLHCKIKEIPLIHSRT